MGSEIHHKLSPGDVTGILVSEGQSVRLTTLSGGQVVDTWAFVAPILKSICLWRIREPRSTRPGFRKAASW
jgi:hypothetical protein